MFLDDKLGMDFELAGQQKLWGLMPWRIPRREVWATSLVWVRKAYRDKPRGSLFPTKQMMEAMLEEAISENLTIVGWNVTFDIMVLLGYGLEELVFKAKWLDGMLIWKHATIEPEYDVNRNNKQSFSLKALVPAMWPQHAGYENDIDYDTTDPVKLQQLHEYNIKDVEFTLLGAGSFWSLLSDRQKRTCLIEAECLPMVARANYHGMRIDPLVLGDLRQQLKDQAKNALAALVPHGMTETIVRSPAKLRKLMFEDWGLTPLKKTDGGDDSTDKETLHELSIIDARVKHVRKYREALNQITKYVDAPAKAAEYNEDGYARPQQIVFGTYTGRFTVSSSHGKNKDKVQTGFALHQEKRDKKFREKVVAPPGYAIVEFDAAGQEFRWMAECSGDDVMKSLCLPGEDPHSYMGSRIDTTFDYQALVTAVKGGDKVAGNIRYVGKFTNLAMQYRVSAKKALSVARVDYGIDMVMSEATKIHDVYPITYRGVPRFWNSSINLVKVRGYAETLSGRRVQVKGNWGGPFGWSMGSTAINYVIQGTGGEQKYLALCVIKNYLRQIGAYFAWDLHDGIYLYVPITKVDECIRFIKNKLDNLPYQQAWGYTPSIPLPWDAKWGMSWGKLNEWKEAA